MVNREMATPAPMAAPVVSRGAHPSRSRSLRPEVLGLLCALAIVAGSWAASGVSASRVGDGSATTSGRAAPLVELPRELQTVIATGTCPELNALFDSLVDGDPGTDVFAAALARMGERRHDLGCAVPYGLEARP